MFISTSKTFSDVRQMLSSFDSSGLISDQDLFRHTRYIMSQFGTYATKHKSVLINIVNNQAQLPEDFNLVYAVYLCTLEGESNLSKISTYRGYYGNPLTLTLRDWYHSLDYNHCDVKFRGEECYVTRTVYREFESITEDVKINTREPLSIDKKITKQSCDSCCINLSHRSQQSFHIIDNVIYTNFAEGYINLEYYALPIDEDGYPLIIEEPLIEQAVEDYLIFKSLQKIYYNGDADVQGRMVTAKQEHVSSLKDALYLIKLPTWKSMVDYAKKRKNYLNLFNISSDSDYGNRIQQHPQRTQFRRF